MPNTLTDLLAHQFEATLCMLHQAVARCPAANWTQLVAAWPFCRAAFHAVFFGDIYLQPSDDIAALKRQPFHTDRVADFASYAELSKPEFEDRAPPAFYAQPFVLTYLQFVREKAQQTLAAETPATLAGPSGFTRRPCTRAELHVYNLRHLQHHAGQLILRLRLDTDVDVPWVGHAWKGA